MTISSKKIKQVEILLEGSGPSNTGWWAMYCPYHGDSKRSAGLNVDTGEFTCHGCNEHKTIDEIIADKPQWNIRVPGRQNSGVVEITQAQVEGWHAALLSNPQRMNALITRRGLSMGTINKYELGWDISQAAYTIPIRNSNGQLINIRFYQLDPSDERRKIWSVEGHGSPVLWPTDQLDYVNIVVCEGELDALLTIQNGIPAITRTGAAGVWDSSWSPLFAKKIVYICHDADDTGHKANIKVAANLRNHALRTIRLELPFERTPSHGKDLTDYWLLGNTRKDFIELAKLASSKVKDPPLEEEKIKNEVFSVNVMNSFDAALVGTPLQMKVTIVGKKIPSFAIPSKIDFSCGINAPGTKCDTCPMSKAEGHIVHLIEPEDQIILKLVSVPEEKMMDSIRKHVGIPKCSLFKAAVQDHRTVEEVFVRASIEDGPSHAEQDFTHRKVISSTTHDLTSNQTVILTGTIRPQPKNQTNEFQAWAVRKPPTGLDNFRVSKVVLEEMQEFRSEDPMAKMAEIADDLAIHYTNIFQRRELHIFADLVFHSILEVPLQNSNDRKGWLDAIVMGDTRTGKSAMAKAMIEVVYGAGEMISCEAASFAGVVGGLEQVGENGWVVKWGSVPLFDRRIVVLDETSGLKTTDISQMSSIRSEGKAELVKIHSEQAMARTRLLWLGNARDGKPLNTHTYAITALKSLIGNNEDIARFDMAMCVFSDDVASEEINKFRSNGQSGRFTIDGYRGVLQWAWTRKAEDVKWFGNAEELVLKEATRLGNLYMEDPPLVQSNNVRMKIARIAAAMAARTYSTNNGKRLLIKPHHVHAAVEFLSIIYGNEKFGYGILSSQVVSDTAIMLRNMDVIKDYIASRPTLLELIKVSPDIGFMRMRTFVKNDDEVREIMVRLWELKACKATEQGMRVEPQVLSELRGMISG